MVLISKAPIRRSRGIPGAMWDEWNVTNASFSSPSNESDELDWDEDVWEEGRGVALAGVLLLFSAATVFGNALVMAAVLRERALHAACTNYFVLSLAVADCLVGLLSGLAPTTSTGDHALNKENASQLTKIH
ncbi:hypothetical protein B566_EDAN014054 [Ephemera danica]|nr:hypothetical protein B566_EDAN014054 [Ephemera danica]